MGVMILEIIEFNNLPDYLKADMVNKLTISEQENFIKKQKDFICDNVNILSNDLKYINQKEFGSQKLNILELDKVISYVLWTKKKFVYAYQQPDSVYQWDIFYCDLGVNLYSETSKSRPVLVLQNMRNYTKSTVVTIAPITTCNGSHIGNLYNHEIMLSETKNSKVRGIIDLAQIRTVSKARLDFYRKDRLLTEDEYSDKYKGEKYVTIQTKVKKALKNIFDIL
jgi:mRNA-degrading endonuclease toxin of MazEF toxin-antitoxin module